MMEVKWVVPPDVSDHFNHRDLVNSSNALRRFPYETGCTREQMVKYLLEIQKPVEYNSGKDKSKKEEDSMNEMEKELDKMWRLTGQDSVDVEEELRDLHKVYIDAEEHLKNREANALDQATFAMKKFIDVQEERKKVSKKLSKLKDKMCDLSDCKHEDEEE